MKVVCVTGTPGTGKTTLSKRLAKKLNFYYVDVNKVIFKHKLSEGYDRKRKTRIVDVKRLNRALIKNIKSIKNKNIINKIKKYKGIVIDSHLSHYMPRKYVDLCIVTKCNIKELNKRLKDKRFGKSKIEENLQSEIFGICHSEAKQMKHKIMVIDTAKNFSIGSVARKM